MKVAALFVFAMVAVPAVCFAQQPNIAFVPLDDRPVTRQLPQMLGRIAGVSVQTPDRTLLGHYLTPGKPDELIAWLNTGARTHASDFVISTDMLAYGGLVASRVPGVRYEDAYFRLKELAHLRAIHPRDSIGAFGTIMRLAPTAVPAIGPGRDFFAAFPVWKDLQEYANLHDPPLASEQATAAGLAASIGGPTLQAYLDTRARNFAVDLLLVQYVAGGAVDRAALGQDDAGPVGLHVKEVHALQDAVAKAGLANRISIEPGADELGMAMIARALAHQIQWTPHVAVHYSVQDGASYNDPLEFAPISVAIDGLISLCGGVHDDAQPDFTLFVRVPKGGAQADADLLAAIQTQVSSGASVALADLTFLGDNTFKAQAAFAKQLLDSGAARRLDAYASWNTNANTVGTALAETIAANVGRRAHRYNALAHAEFTFNRFLDDYAFHDYVRPDLNAWLDQHGTTDHTYLLQDVAQPLSERNNALLWNDAAVLLQQLYPGYHIAAIKLTLPWDRTFETEIDVGLAPALPR